MGNNWAPLLGMVLAGGGLAAWFLQQENKDAVKSELIVEWTSVSQDDALVEVTGIVLLPDGQPAEGALVTMDWGDGTGSLPEIVGHTGQFSGGFHLYEYGDYILQALATLGEMAGSARYEINWMGPETDLEALREHEGATYPMLSVESE